MPDNNRELLTDAVARSCALVLSLPSAGMLRHQKSRFLSETEHGLWLETNADEFALIEQLIGTKQSAGISFKNGQTKVVFASPILELDRQHRINSETVVPAILVAVPDVIKAIQRRSNYRVRIFQGCELSARIWRISPRAYIGDRPMSTAELHIVFRDLSIGGMGVTFQSQDGAAPKISTEDRLRIEIRFHEATILIEGRMRQPTGPQSPNSIFTGVQFKDMGNDLEGRQKLSQLTRIIGDMQREEARRARLGIG
jgi:c-di-GMP-binding flagellar brake protein YcgR